MKLSVSILVVVLFIIVPSALVIGTSYERPTEAKLAVCGEGADRVTIKIKGFKHRSGLIEFDLDDGRKFYTSMQCSIL